MFTSKPTCFNKQCSEKKYIQLICVTKTRNGKLVALALVESLTTAGKAWYFFGPVKFCSVWWKGSLYQTECLVKWERLW